MHTRTAAWIDQGLGRGSCKIKLTRFWMSNKLRNLCIRKDNGLGLFLPYHIALLHRRLLHLTLFEASVIVCNRNIAKFTN